MLNPQISLAQPEGLAGPWARASIAGHRVLQEIVVHRNIESFAVDSWAQKLWEFCRGPSSRLSSGDPCELVKRVKWSQYAFWPGQKYDRLLLTSQLFSEKQGSPLEQIYHIIRFENMFQTIITDFPDSSNTYLLNTTFKPRSCLLSSGNILNMYPINMGFCSDAIQVQT